MLHISYEGMFGIILGLKVIFTLLISKYRNLQAMHLNVRPNVTVVVIMVMVVVEPVDEALIG